MEGLRAHVRTMGYLRGTPQEVAQWREDMAESCVNIAIEDMILSADEDAMFAKMLDKRPPPSLMPSIILT